MNTGFLVPSIDRQHYFDLAFRQRAFAALRLSSEIFFLLNFLARAFPPRRPSSTAADIFFLIAKA